jgi:hypothetical protein
MEKKRFGPKLKMNGLPKASKAKVNFLSLPKEIETPFDTSYGENGKTKWEMDIELFEHPNQEIKGYMVWQTTASVIRLEIMNLVNEGTKEDCKNLLIDLKSCEWYISSDANGQISIEEV